MTTVDKCAQEVLDLIPLVMKTIRNEMRKQGALRLTIPEFRTLAFIRNHPGSSLSQVAEHIGVMLPSMSRMIDTLVQQEYVTRQTANEDRRRMTLSLTRSGDQLLTTARRNAQTNLAEMLKALSPEEREVVANGMKALRTVFSALPLDS